MSTEDNSLKKELISLVDDTAKEVSAILDTCRKEDLLTKFESAIRLLSQSRGVSEIRVARDKLHLLLETLENFRDQVGPEEVQDLEGVCKMCFRELSVSMSVLERAFVDSLDGQKLHRVLKELILKMDNALMEVKKKNIDLISFGAEEIRREVNAFYDEFVNDESEERYGDEGAPNGGLQKKLIEMQMQLMSKNQTIENYAHEIETLNNRIRVIGGGDGSNFDINAIYSDIENLNKTIDHLRRENQKLRQSMIGLAGEDRSNKEDSRSHKAEGVDSLADKLNSLENRIKSGPNNSDIEVSRNKQIARIAELEADQHRLTREIVDLEEAGKNYKKDIEAIEFARGKIQENLSQLIEDHEQLKSKSQELLKRNAVIEGENEVLRKEKTLLVDNILSLQKNHQDELNSLRSTLESLSDKLYVVGLDSENKQTFSDLEHRHSSERKAWTEKNRQLQEACEQLQKDNSTLEDKIEEQHQVISMYARMEETLKTEQRRLKDLESEFDTLSDNYTSLEAERDEAFSQIKQLERELTNSKEDCSRLKEDATSAVRTREDLQRHKSDIEKRLADSQREIEDLNTQIRNLEGDKRSSDKTISQFKTEVARTNDILKMSKDEITSLQDVLEDRRKEVEVLEKDRSFLKKKVERLEDQLFQKEKKFLRDEAEKEVDNEDKIRGLIEENETLKEEIIILERANSRLFSDVEYYKSSPATSGSAEKLRVDYDKLKDVFKRSEVTWLKERQSLLNEIEQLRDGKPEPGYTTMRPDRDLPDTREGKFLSTYGSTGMRSSPHQGHGQAPDSSHSKSKKILS